LRAVLADTGPLYALFNASDQYHARAQSDLVQLELDHLEIVVPYPVYFESYSLVLYRLSFEYAQTFARELTQ
jgi:predicted nucleic acid-binding protein